nr:helix-turn-helix transcriptional regulator [Paenibacillus tengchongensis]
MIRDQLAAYLAEQCMSINQFAVRSGINSGTLSRIITGQQSIAMSHLELITEGMGKPQDFFFSLYVDECLYYSVPTWRRLRPFIMSCAALNRLDCIERIVQTLLDNLTYAPMLFDTAEELFQLGQWQAAALLYENVSASEKYQYSERLAICQYRLFKIALGEDQNKNLRAAILFECYVYKLDEMDQLDALKDLAHVFSSLHQWDKVEDISKTLHRLASLQYDLFSHSGKKREEQRKTSRPLYGYILYSYLLRSLVYEDRRDYSTALYYVSKYADGAWIKEQDQEAKETIFMFQEWATANTYLYRVLDGQKEILDEYVEYISTKDDEIFFAVYKIVESANRYRWNVDHILDRFGVNFSYQEYSTPVNQQMAADQYAVFLIEIAIYYLERNEYRGIQYLFKGLEFSCKINFKDNIIKCVNLFEQYRINASEDEIKQYKTLISEVYNNNEKKKDTITSSLC